MSQLQPGVAQMFEFAGRCAVVTGASSGLGVTFAKALAGAGARVALVARRAERLDAVAKEIGSAGGQALAVPADVTDPGQVQAMASTVLESFGRVDIVVNNAGAAADGGIVPEKVPPDLYEKTLRVNVLGSWYCAQLFGQRMLSDGKGGTIINVSSILGSIGWPDFAPAYQASKAALENMTRNLACSWGNRRVRVNTLAPGWFRTEMTDPFLGLEGVMDHLRNLTPLGRIGQHDELVGALLFLASDASSFVTGHTLVVDGGLSAGAARWPDAAYSALGNAVPAGLGVRIGL
jgi:NAD(P)-dependent dehydrogenase (short-subunit alcohol dehydrogenase family)